jgi:hypothetical protein
MPPKGSYIAGWTICDKLGVDRGQLDCRIPGTQYDDALKELIDAGVVEKHPKLGCRYRLCQKQTEQLHTSCPQRVLDMLDSPEYDLYQEVEGDQEILQRLGTHFRYFDDLLTDIG